MESVDIKLIANIIGLIGSLLMVLMGILKKKNDVLFVQNVQLILLSISNIMVGGYIGTFVNFIAVFRNILCSKGKLNMFWVIIITIITITLGVIVNREGLVGFVPIIATLIFLFFMNIKDMVKFKILTAVVMFLWFIYDLELGVYTTAFFDLITLFSSLVCMYHIAHNRPNIKKTKKKRRKNKSK